MATRRGFLVASGMGCSPLFSCLLSQRATFPDRALSEIATLDRLQQEIVAMPYDDSHCHAISEVDARIDTRTTPDAFLRRIALSAFPLRNYFPRGVFDRWSMGDIQTRQQLDEHFRIERIVNEVTYHIRNSVFVTYMVKEMAGYLNCRPILEEVIDARNERAKDYYRYMNGLFRDVRVENVMVDTGCCAGLTPAGLRAFETAIRPATLRPLARVDQIQDAILDQDISFEALETQFLAAVRQALDGNGNFGMKSYGMKSYLLPDIGLIRPVYDAKVARRSWEEYKRFRGDTGVNGEERDQVESRAKELREYLLTLAIEECYKRDMPMQFHSGDGEAPHVILRNQHPYYLEEVVRSDKDGIMRMPKIIPIHAGYPLIGEAAWLSHLYANCYFEVSLMNPLIGEGLARRFLEILEVVPFSKVLFGSDAYDVPELYWLAGRWGKLYLSLALAKYVREGIASEEEVLRMAQMILSGNNRRVYNLSDRPS
jgi:predicted TIM-barrel fold metal-dependent hydrolase